jgi:hypothetical protein
MPEVNVQKRPRQLRSHRRIEEMLVEGLRELEMHPSRKKYLNMLIVLPGCLKETRRFGQRTSVVDLPPPLPSGIAVWHEEEENSVISAIASVTGLSMGEVRSLKHELHGHSRPCPSLKGFSLYVSVAFKSGKDYRFFAISAQGLKPQDIPRL